MRDTVIIESPNHFGWTARFANESDGIITPGNGLELTGTVLALRRVGNIQGEYTNPTVTVDDTGRIMTIESGTAPGIVPPTTFANLTELAAYQGEDNVVVVLDAGDGRSALYLKEAPGEAFKGPAYITPETGERGLKGEKGDTGERGPAGENGLKGADGLQGEQGERGASILPNAYGNIDEDRIAFIRTQPGDYFFLVNPSGDLRTNKAIPSSLGGDISSHLVGWNGTVFTDYGQLTGAQGPRGLQGVQGDPGVRGLAGADGAKGEKGEQGVQGISGLRGERGEQGIQGAKGATGDNGAQGIQGPQGIKGDAGDAGQRGAQGIQGATGERGIQGQQGIQGAAGPKGDNGTQGIQGIQGLTGAQGPNGFVWNLRTLSTAGSTVGPADSGYLVAMTGTATTLTVNALATNEYIDVANNLSSGTVTVTHGGSSLIIYTGEIWRFYGASSRFFIRRSARSTLATQSISAVSKFITLTFPQANLFERIDAVFTGFTATAATSTLRFQMSNSAGANAWTTAQICAAQQTGSTKTSGILRIRAAGLPGEAVSNHDAVGAFFSGGIFSYGNTSFNFLRMFFGTEADTNNIEAGASVSVYGVNRL